MNYKNQLIELSVIVNDGLTTYIKVHDTIHDESETFWSSIKNLFGFGVPMANLLRIAEDLIPVWDSISAKMDDFNLSSYSGLSNTEKKYFDTLIKYVEALQKTVQCLVDRQKLLAAGSEKFGSMSWKEHQEKRAIYQASIEEYLLIGQELNMLAESVIK